MKIIKPRTTSRASRAVMRAMPQSFPQQTIDLTKQTIKEPDVNQGTSPRINEGTTDKTTTCHRPCDDMLPLPSPDKNRTVFTLADNSRISQGGVMSPDDKLPTHSPDGNVITSDYKYR